MISYVLPTRNRPAALVRTLRAIGRLSGAAHEAAGGGEVIVVDNASAPPSQAPRRLANGLDVHVVRPGVNLMAAARNIGAAVAAGTWLVMLDDDSSPIGVGHLEVIRDAPPHVAAIGGEILLPDGTHEAGGLPEVIVGCGAIVRREAFLDVGGYDPAFGYYAEEYDLCAKLIRRGWRNRHDFRFRVRHRRVADGRDTNRMLRHLVRNNAWVIRRYAPPGADVTALVEIMSERYRRIAAREGAMSGFRRGQREMIASLGDQPRCAMTPRQWHRFTGAATARHALRRWNTRRIPRVAVVEPGKNVEVIRSVLEECGMTMVERARDAGFVVIGTLSPGPLLDGTARWAAQGARVMVPWAHLGRRSPASAFASCRLKR